MFWPWQLATFATRPWRLVPELDAFDDRECAAFTAAISKQRAFTAFCSLLIAIFVGPLAAIGWTIFADTGLKEVWPGFANPAPGTFGSRLFWSTTALVTVGFAIWAALTPYCLVLRRLLHNHLRSVVCPACRYALVGLPVAEGAVLCPECGMAINLEEHGLRPADLLTGERERNEADLPGGGRKHQIRGRALLAGAAVLSVGWLVSGFNPLLLGVVCLGIVHLVMAEPGTAPRDQAP